MPTTTRTPASAGGTQVPCSFRSRPSPSKRKQKPYKFEVLDPVKTWEGLLRIVIPVLSDEPETLLRYLNTGSYGELIRWAKLASRTEYGTPEEHYRANQLAGFIRKYPLDPRLVGTDPELQAKCKFSFAENRNRRTNAIIRAVMRDPLRRPELSQQLSIAARWIQHVLGPFPDMSKIRMFCDFTGGSTTDVGGKATNIGRKLLSSDWSVTSSCLPYVFEALWDNIHVREHILECAESYVDYETLCVVEILTNYSEFGPIKPGPRLRLQHWRVYAHDKDLFKDYIERKLVRDEITKIKFVSKDADIHRTITIHPTLNQFLQKGIGEYMTRCLSRAGLDLRDQKTNQIMACSGSFDAPDGYCTIDLSSASDTLSRELVAALLPPEWYDLLDDCRCKLFELDGREAMFHMFSSMGNGFTFPLQTLIFASLCRACYMSQGIVPDLRVYGDDIIVRKSVFLQVISLLRKVGFMPNPKKTFGHGPFRESCGADWYDGINVRPILLTKALEDEGYLYGIHNQIVRRGGFPLQILGCILPEIRRMIPHRRRCLALHEPAPLSFRALDTGEETGWGTSDSINGAFWVPLDVFMAGKFTTWDKATMSWRGWQIIAKSENDASLPVEEFASLQQIGAFRGYDLRFSRRTTGVYV